MNRDYIRNKNDLPTEEHQYAGDDEVFAMRTSLSRPLGLERIGVHHDLLLPQRRTSYPHAESTEEECVYVLEGTPDAWIDGELVPLIPGDMVVFKPGTGIAHSIQNNTAGDVKLLVIGEKRADNQIIYPLNPDRTDSLPKRKRWEDAPLRPLGSSSAIPGKPARTTECQVGLRLPRAGDAKVLFDLINKSNVTDTIVWDGPQSEAELNVGLLYNAAETEAGNLHFFVIEDLKTGVAIGSCDVRPANAWSGDMGIWIGPRHQGQGHGTHAIALLTEYGHTKLKLGRLEAKVFVGNYSSRRTFEKCGYQLEGTLRAAIIKRTKPVDEWLLASVR